MVLNSCRGSDEKAAFRMKSIWEGKQAHARVGGDPYFIAP